MIAFSKIDSRISKDVCDKIRNHLWYLSEHTVGFSFFDEGVQIEELRKMVNSLQNREGSEQVLPRLGIPNVQVLGLTNLSDFATKNTMYFFELLSLPTDFLHEDPERWGQSQSYQLAKEVNFNFR